MREYLETSIEADGYDIPVTVEYEYTKGEPEELPRFGEAGNPGTGDTVNIFEVVDVEGFDWFDSLEGYELDRIESEVFAKHERG